MGVRSPGSPCNICPKHEDGTCPYFNLVILPSCKKWFEFARKTQEKVKAEFRAKHEKRKRKKI